MTGERADEPQEHRCAEAGKEADSRLIAPEQVMNSIRGQHLAVDDEIEGHEDRKQSREVNRKMIKIFPEGTITDRKRADDHQEHKSLEIPPDFAGRDERCEDTRRIHMVTSARSTLTGLRLQPDGRPRPNGPSSPLRGAGRLVLNQFWFLVRKERIQKNSKTPHEPGIM